MGVPKKPVTTLNGISVLVKLREIMSTTTMKIAPTRIVKGMVFFVFLPTISLEMCGTIKPIQPIIPEIATVLAVSKVAQMMTIKRSSL